MKKDYDVIIIGGGILGCFAARNLMRYNLTAALFEEKDDICTGITAANTAIVYGSQDHHPDTKKAKFCADANKNFDDLCSELGVRFHRCGSLMVCFGEGGFRHLKKCYDRGIAMGLHGLKILSGEEAIKLEPALNPDVYRALYCPDTGTVNPWELGIAAAENARANGAEIFTDTSVTSIEKINNSYSVTAGGKKYTCRILFNCSGMACDRITDMLTPSPVRIVPTAGDYIILDTNTPNCPKHIIFHEPEAREKGITAVPTTDGNILLGPSERLADTLLSRKTEHDGLSFVKNTAKKVFPKIPLERTIRSFGAFRPNPYFHKGVSENGEYILSDEKINDFEVFAPEEYPGFISFAGIKTPGLTCANELTLYWIDKVVSDFGINSKNPDFDPVRKAPPRLSEMSNDERKKAYTKNSAYANIVCRCRTVSEVEVADAIKRCFGKATLDSVKRRAGTGMGRCQGGYCSLKITDIINKNT